MFFFLKHGVEYTQQTRSKRMKNLLTLVTHSLRSRDARVVDSDI